MRRTLAAALSISCCIAKNALLYLGAATRRRSRREDGVELTPHSVCICVGKLAQKRSLFGREESAGTQLLSLLVHFAAIFLRVQGDIYIWWPYVRRRIAAVTRKPKHQWVKACPWRGLTVSSVSLRIIHRLQYTLFQVWTMESPRSSDSPGTPRLNSAR